MPRLGNDDEEEGVPLMPVGNRRRDREATAYAANGMLARLQQQQSVLKLVLLLAVFIK